MAGTISRLMVAGFLLMAAGGCPAIPATDQTQEVVFQVKGEMPPAELVSLAEYKALSDKYKWTMDESQPPDHQVRLVSFDDKTVTVGLVKITWRPWGAMWVRRLQLERNAEVDRDLGITRILAERAKVIGGVKWGMTVEEVIRAKGRHYRFEKSPKEDRGTMIYDDVVVGVEAMNGESGKVSGVWEVDNVRIERLRNTPYADGTRDDSEPQDIVQQVGGVPCRAEPISLDEYKKLQEYYSQLKNSRTGVPGDWTNYYLHMVSFGRKTVTMGLLTQHKSKGWNWSRRFTFARSEEADRVLGINRLLEERAKADATVIGGVKWGMKVSDVIKLKGLHHRVSHHQRLGSADLLYDDAVVGVTDWHRGGDTGVVSGVRPIAEVDKRFYEDLPYEDDVVKVSGKPPVAETISLEEYGKLKAYYAKPENHWADPNRRIPQFVQLVRFDDKMATAGVLRERGKNVPTEWVRRFEFVRSGEVDKELGVAAVVEQRSKVIGGVKWGMSMADVIALKGKHYKYGIHQRAGAMSMCYDDVIVGMHNGGYVEYVLPGNWNRTEDMNDVPYMDERP